MPLTPEQEAALKKFAAERQAYDNTPGVMLRSGSIARDVADQAGVSSIDAAMARNAQGGPMRPSTPEELAILNQAKQGVDQSNFVRAARAGALNAKAQPQQQQTTTHYPRRTTDTVIEANNIPPKMGGGIGNLLSNIFGGGGSSQPPHGQAQQPVQPQQVAPQQSGQNWAQALLEGFGAGAQGMSVPQMRLMQAQAKMQQFEVQDKMRTQAAQQNFPQFQQKMKAFRPFWKQFTDQKKREDPNFVPGPETFVQATESWDEQFPEMAISQTDQDTFNRTAQGTQALLGMGLLPLNDMLEVKKLGLAEDAKQRAAFQASLMGMPQNQQDVNYAQQVLAGEHPQSQGPFTPFQQKAQQTGLDLQASIAEATAKQRAKTQAIPVMNGQEANAMMRQRMAPLLTDPTTLNFYGDDQQVSLEQMNKDAEELGKNLRESRKAESREGMQAERLAAKSSEAEKTRTAAASLATMKMENLNANSEKGRDLKMRLAVMDDKFKEAQQKRTFTQQQLQDQFKAEASLNRQREMLQTKAGIAFTLEGMQSDPDQAIKFALEAERAGNATARGLIGDVLETNPSLAWPILERLGTLSKENGLSQNSVTAVKGAIEDYMKRKSTFSMEEMAQDIVNGPGTDKDKNTKLAMELRKAKSSGNTQAADYYQFLLDSRKSAGQQINIDNRPPPDGGIPLGKRLTEKQTEQLYGSQNALGVIDSLRDYMKATPISGLAGLKTAINNVVAGTMYDFSRISVGPDGVDAQAYRDLFEPSLEPGRLLANQLKYMVARAREGSGQLAKSDIEAVNIGTSYITDDSLSLESAINGLEAEMYRVMEETSERLNQGGLKINPTPSDRDVVIQSFVDDPDFGKYSDRRLRIDIQDLFRRGSNTLIGSSEINSIIREIKARRK